jgi:hypothetical protein
VCWINCNVTDFKTGRVVFQNGVPFKN